MNGRTNSHNNTTGFEIEVPLDPVTDVSTSAGDGQVELTWTDPLDKYAATEGEVAESPNPIVSQWDHTRVVRKENTQPTGPNDGVIVLSSDVRNQYQSTSYVDSGLANDTLYHYGLFACNTAGLFSAGAFGSAIPKAGTPLSQLSEGTIIKILENGSPVEFYLAKHNYEPELNGEGRELVVRKDAWSTFSWNYGMNQNSYPGSKVDVELNTNYSKTLSSKVVDMISMTKFKYTVGNDSAEISTYERPVFLLAYCEVGGTYLYENNIGSLLPISQILKVTDGDQMTRSATNQTRVRQVLYCNRGGGPIIMHTNEDGNVRPAFTLPNTITVDSGMNVGV